jgi:hypothetical protein
MAAPRAVPRARIASLVAAMCASALLAGCAPPPRVQGPAALVLVITPSLSSRPAAYRAGEALAAARSRGTSAPYAAVRHAVLPDSGSGKSLAAALSAALLDSAKDPLIRAVLVAPAIEGTAEAFRAFRGRRHDVALIAAESAEERLSIESAADLVVDLDRLYRPYFAAAAAKEAGAARLVAATAKGPSSPVGYRETAVLRAACAELGLAFDAVAADPGERVGSPLGALDRGCALYCADAALADAVVGAALSSGAAVVDGGPGSLEAYSRALASRLPDDAGKADAAKRLKLLEKAAVAAAGRGRLAAWVGDYQTGSVEGLGEFARRAALGSARVDDLKALVAALRSASPGIAWLAAYDADPATGVKSANHVLLRQDPYSFGRGYAQTALLSMPARYLAMGSDAP